MTSPLQTVSWEEAPLLRPGHDAAIQADIKRHSRGAPGLAEYFIPCPWLARGIPQLDFNHGLLVDLDFELSDLIILVVSQENACRFCYAGTRMQLRMLGMNEERVQELERRLSSGGLDARTNAAVRFARALSRANPPPGRAELTALANAGLTQGEVRELAFAAASTGSFNRLATLPALPPQMMEQMPDKWFMPLMRPLVARMMRNWRWRGQPSSRPLVQDVPCATVLAAFQGSPIGDVLADVLREMWAPTALSRRAKALMGAVIARGIGSPASLRDFSAILVEEGLQPQEVEQILANLGGPQLDAVESALVTFARDTISYEPRTVQRRTRSLIGSFEEPALVEALGVAALADLLCRTNLALVDAA